MITIEQRERYFSPEGFRHFQTYLERQPGSAMAGSPCLGYTCPLFKWLEAEGLPISSINLEHCILEDDVVAIPIWMCTFQYLAIQASKALDGSYHPITVYRARDILEDTADLLGHIGLREDVGVGA